MATAAPTKIFAATSRSPLEYWHLLSLDAPTVAVVWAWMLCNATHVSVPASSVILIGLGTWLFYVADRILDAARPLDPAKLRERHYFHHAHRTAFGIAGVSVLAGLCLLALHDLPARTLSLFSPALIAALGYFAVVHLGAPAVLRWFPKELAVGAIFAAALALPAWSQLSATTQHGQFLAAVSLIAALFWLNCVAIESWESGSPGAQPARDSALPAAYRVGRSKASLATPVRLLAAGITFAAIGCLVGDFRSSTSSILPSIYLSIVISAAVLFYLDIVKFPLSPLRLRIAADLALLTPLPFLLSAPALMFPRVLLAHGAR